MASSRFKNSDSNKVLIWRGVSDQISKISRKQHFPSSLILSGLGVDL